MKRPNAWLRRLVLACVVLGLAEYAALTIFAPRYVMRAVERAAGGELSIARARLSFPLTTRLSDLRLATNTTEAGLSIQRAVIRPRWFSPAERMLWVDRLQLDRPFLRVTRAKDGTFRWPSLPQPVSRKLSAAAHASPETPSWRLRLGTVSIVDGIIDFIDERPTPPFRAILSHLSIDLGPVAIPQDGSQTAFAVRGELTGAGGSAALIYCSGWVDLSVKDLEASCRLEPLALEAFDPYYHGPREVRVFGTTLRLTSQWLAKANDFSGRIQFELGNLREGGLSVNGRTIVNGKPFAADQEAKVKGEISVTGPLDNPREWHAAFRPADEQAQRLLTRLLDRGVELIKVPFWGYSIRVGLAPSSQATMTDIEATSKEIQEALEILAVPEPPPAPEPSAAPAPTPTASPAQ